MARKVKQKTGAPMDANGKPIEVGCKLCSKLFPDNKVVCESIEPDGRVWLKQTRDGSIAFLVEPTKARWIVTAYPDKKDDKG